MSWAWLIVATGIVLGTLTILALEWMEDRWSR